MKPVIGKSYEAKRDDVPDTYYVFKFVHSRIMDGETYFLGVKTGAWIDFEIMESGGDSIWFDDEGLAISDYGPFYLTKKSRSKRD